MRFDQSSPLHCCPLCLKQRKGSREEKNHVLDILFKMSFTYVEKERKRECQNRRKDKTERDRESEADSPLSAEPSVGFDL